MIPDRRKGTTVPIWTAVSLIIAILVGMSGVYFGWAQQVSKLDYIQMQQQIRQFENEFAATHKIDFTQTAAISDTKEAVAAIQEQTKQIPEIRALLIDLIRRVK